MSINPEKQQPTESPIDATTAAEWGEVALHRFSDSGEGPGTMSSANEGGASSRIIDGVPWANELSEASKPVKSTSEIIDSVPWANELPERSAPEVTQDRMPTYGGYTGRRLTQMPGVLWQSGMPVSPDMLTNPKQGDPNVPNLGPGDPRHFHEPGAEQQ